MDKETLSNYGWIVICILVLSVMIALATPFGSFVSGAVKSTAEGLFDVNSSALEAVGIVTGDQSFNKDKNGTITLMAGETYAVSGAQEQPITVKGNGTLKLEDVVVEATDGPALIVESGTVKVVVNNNTTLEGGVGSDGIYVAAGAKLELTGSGHLVAIGNGGNDAGGAAVAMLTADNEGGSGIGGAGEIYIHDLANLTAEGYGYHACGIGGVSKNITIVNTTITTVRGGYVQPLFVNDTKYGKSEPEGGAAIGSFTDGAVITLRNVKIGNALGGSKAAGIGACYWTGVTINIDGCTIDNVEGGNASAGIGGSRVASGATRADDVIININNSTIKATGGQYAAGIGGGYDTYCRTMTDATPICTINIKGNSVITAQGGQYAAGIGTGFHNAALAGNIESTVTVNATSGTKFYKDTYTQAQNIGFGVVDPAREGKDNNCSITYNGTVIAIPEVQ